MSNDSARDNMTIFPEGTDKYAPITPRILEMRELIRDRTIIIDAERLKIVTDTYKELKNYPVAIKKATATNRVLSNMTTLVEDFEVIFGNFGQNFLGHGWWPEDDACGWITMEPKFSDMWTHDDERGVWTRLLVDERTEVSDETMAALEEAHEFWKDESITAHLNAYVPEWGPEMLYQDGATIMGPPFLGFTPEGHLIAGYNNIIEHGYKYYRDWAQGWLDEHRGWLMGDDAEKWMFYKSVVLAADGCINMVKNYAKTAREKAETCEDPKRKAELLSRADSMDWISENPPRTFWEAVQTHIFYHQAFLLETRHPAIGIGRVDQFWWPFLKKELDEGTITMDEAQEIVDAFFLKLNCYCYARAAMMAQAIGIGNTGQHVTIGGVDPKTGEDATNPITYMCLQTIGRLLLHDPATSLRINKNTPADLWIAALEMTKRVGGLPLFQNDEVLIPAMLDYGYELEDARNYGFIGCQEAVGCGNDMPFCNGHNLRVSVLMTCTVNNGINPMTGKAGPVETGYLYEMESYEQFREAYLTQMKVHQDAMVSMMNWGEMLCMWYRPHAVLSFGMIGCMENGKDCACGGAKYNSYGGSNHGFATVADSLTAVRWACFDEKICTTREMYDAIMANWEGYEELRQKLLNDCPHYGNDDPYADEQMSWIIGKYFDVLGQYNSKRCKFFRPGLYGGAAHVEEGLMCWATPDGRLARTPVADSTSPAQGRDVNGPTAVFNSTLCFDHHKLLNGMSLNIKVHPNSMTGEGQQKLIEMVQSYFDRGGLEVQFNIVSADVMKAAQKDPEAYKDLVVRIAGFSAFFIELTEAQQNDVIIRNEHMF